MTTTEANEVISKLFKAEEEAHSYVAKTALAQTTEKYGNTATAESTAFLMAKTQRLSFTHGAISVLYNLGVIEE